jgi:hypothetical protein
VIISPVCRRVLVHLLYNIDDVIKLHMVSRFYRSIDFRASREATTSRLYASGEGSSSSTLTILQDHMLTGLSDDESLSSDVLALHFLLSRRSNCASGLQSCSNVATLFSYNAFI